MKNAAFHGNDHAKSFKVALGIAFTLLALVVVYVAFSKGGLDIRSKAASVSNVTLTGISPKCPYGYVLQSTSTYMLGSTLMKRILCRKISLPTPRPTTPIKTPTRRPTYKVTATPTKVPTPTSARTGARCCPKANTQSAKNTCYGATQTICNSNSNYCVWTNAAYCSY